LFGREGFAAFAGLLARQVGCPTCNRGSGALKPVTFRYRKEIDPDATPQFGLVAEDVARVNPDLVVCDADGKIHTVRYEAVNAMLLNEFLKEHKTFVEEQRRVQGQGAIIARQQKQIEALTAGLQKVSAQLELSNPAPQTVLNNR
jgi:trimeric autotransporter adhesin